ncbi:hypothetical protein TYRP_018890 [Tyrophagus putrescentiae]|nr:hypothetical protein TYRP_018890 [Tyrophagus putrescentiae]
MSQKSITSFFKAVPSKRKLEEEEADSLNSSKKILKDANAAFSSQIQDEIDRLALSFPALSPNIGHSWFSALKSQFSQPYFKELSDFIVMERKKATVYPPQTEVYSWTRYCEIQQVKVIILGQDPYHGPKQAHGISFSVCKGVPKPPSLVNIFKEIKTEYPEFVIPNHGELIGWAKQGVLMLNASLTVRAGQANSHADRGWDKLTDAVIKHINDNSAGRVFMLWGNFAQKKGAFINNKKHLVLKSVHPSPLSASRGFFGCDHFKKANEYLLKHNNSPIDWTKLN